MFFGTTLTFVNKTRAIFRLFALRFCKETLRFSKNIVAAARALLKLSRFSPFMLKNIRRRQKEYTKIQKKYPFSSLILFFLRKYLRSLNCFA